MAAIKAVDLFIFYLVNGKMANPFLDYIMPFITGRGYYLLIPLFIWLLFRDAKKFLLAAALAILALTLADMSANTIKHLVVRPRPFMVLPDVHLLVGRGGPFSMPSGHAANSFAVALALSAFYGGLPGLVFLSWAGLTAFSRVYVGVHYPTDILVGIAVGTLSALIVVRGYRLCRALLKERDYRKLLLIFLIALSLFRIYYIYTGPLDLSPDEAQYWDWSRHPDISYYSKGPMIAYMIAATRWVFGDTVFGVRMGAVLLSAFSSIILFLLVKRVYDEKTAFISAVLLQAVPLFSTFGVIMTIDAPFIFFWIAALYFVWDIYDRVDKGKKTGSAWILLGLIVGLGLLTKYTMALFYLCTLIFMWSCLRLRNELKTPYPYLGFALSIAVFSPVIVWNAGRNWITLRHTAGQAHLADGFIISSRSFFDFIGSQLGVITPVLFGLTAVALVRQRREIKGKFMLWYSLPVFLFFLVKSIQGTVQANWAMTSYLTGLIAFASYYVADPAKRKGRMKYLIAGGTGLAVILTLVSHYPAVLNLPRSMDPTARLRGWKELGAYVSQLSREMEKKGNYFIFSDQYQISSELAFYVDGHPTTYCANVGRRMNQYDLWPGYQDKIHGNAIFVSQGFQDKMPLQSEFEKCTGHKLSGEEKGKIVRTFTIFECYNFQGAPKKEAYRF